MYGGTSLPIFTGQLGGSGTTPPYRLRPCYARVRTDYNGPFY